jgi:hypothetical protein
MAKQKLYTEEQVRKAIELSRDTHQEGKPYLERDEYDYSVDEVVELLTSIELPSDEEIEEESSKWRAPGQAFRGGAKWIKEQIIKNK